MPSLLSVIVLWLFCVPYLQLFFLFVIFNSHVLVCARNFSLYNVQLFFFSSNHLNINNKIIIFSIEILNINIFSKLNFVLLYFCLSSIVVVVNFSFFSPFLRVFLCARKFAIKFKHDIETTMKKKKHISPENNVQITCLFICHLRNVLLFH